MSTEVLIVQVKSDSHFTVQKKNNQQKLFMITIDKEYEIPINNTRW